MREGKRELLGLNIKSKILPRLRFARRICLVSVAAAMVAACGSPDLAMNDDSRVFGSGPSLTNQLTYEGDLPSFAGATGWLNTPPLKRDDLQGKVVLVQFWTFTCINWLRTAPYIRAWAEKYKDNGLVVIGVHTPEFEFEKNAENVRRESKAMSIDYPIAIDSDYGIWNEFKNQYWPALYFVDASGKIRHHQFGEGDYDKSERVIQKLLIEAGQKDLNTDLVTTDGKGVEAPADWNNLRSPENYLGYGRTANFASPGGINRNQRATYSFPGKLSLNQWALAGDWKVSRSASRIEKASGRLAIQFHARDLHLVMGPVNGNTPIRFRVLIDGQPPGSSHGIDTDEQGYGTISAPRMYQLIRQIGPVIDRQFEIEFFGPNVETHAFTFG